MQQQITNKSGVVKDEISLKEVILSVREWWKYLRGRWKEFILAAVVGGILGLIYSLITPVKYKAETSFVLDNAKSAGGVMSIAEKFGLGSSGSNDGLFGDEDNMVIFLKSRTMVEQTLLTKTDFNGTNELLVERYLNFNGFRKKWESPRLKNISFKEYPGQNDLLADSMITVIHKLILKRNLEVEKPDKEGNVIKVTLTSKDELFSKAFTDHLIRNASKFYASFTTKRSLENVMILQRQVDSVKQLLNVAISGIAVSTDAVPNLNPAYQRLKVPSRKSEVDAQLNRAILEELVKNLELAKIDLRRETPLVQIIDSPVLPLEKQKAGKLKSIVIFGIGLLVVVVIVRTLQYYFRRLLKED